MATTDQNYNVEDDQESQESSEEEEKDKENEKLSTIEMKSKNSELRKKGYFQPLWSQRGSRNEALLKDFDKDEEESNYYRIKEKDMDFNKIMPLSRQTQKYPLYCVVQKLDEYLTENFNKVSGFKDNLPTKEYQKYYILHVDPTDTMRLWCSFTNYRFLTNSGKEQ